jgi:hypothetical protein
MNIEIVKIATGVCLGLFAANVIPSTISEVYYAANPCDRPRLSDTAELSCDLNKSLARMKKLNE